jgi:hypothetical protein
VKNGPTRNYLIPGPYGATGPALLNTASAQYRGVKATVEIKDEASIPERYVDVILTIEPHASSGDGPAYTATVRVPSAYQRHMYGHCKLCGRALDQPGIPESLDCGGDCRGCMDEIEKETPKP